MRQVCVHGRGRITTYLHRRVGRPKLKWIEDAFGTAFNKLLNSQDLGTILEELKTSKDRHKTIANSKIMELQSQMQLKIQEFNIAKTEGKYVFNKENDNHQDIICELAHMRLF